MPRNFRAAPLLFLIANLLAAGAAIAGFVTFESGQVRPLAMSPDGNRLFAVNTPDNHLEVFDIKPDGLTRLTSIPVGMEPVAVAARNDNEVWVVNHLSDSVSIIDLSTNPPRVVRTLLVGDEPRDIVFAGPGGNRAFITTAHRGQHSPYNDPSNPGEMITPGLGRADVWVFDAANLGNTLGGAPLTILTHFTDTPRALAVSPDGSIVYAAGFHTGNQTTVISEGAVCDGGAAAAPCTPGAGQGGTLQAPGGLPAPNQNFEGAGQPETGLIVRFNGANWVDELGRDWANQVRLQLPDQDVFSINANANPPIEIASFSGVGTVLFNMVTNPLTGKVYVTNTEAGNEIRFEGARGPGNTTSTVQGRLHLARITVLDGASVIPRHLNKHIDYSVVPAPTAVRDNSLATPTGMAVTGDGSTLYVAAFGSGKIGVFSTAEIENDTFTPSSADHIVLSGGGPAGLALDETRARLYVLTRFNNAVTVVDTASRTEQAVHPLHNPEPAVVTQGRRFLYDAAFTSSNGEASCSSCHVFGDLDSLAWDLGDPEAIVLSNPNPDGPLAAGGAPFHPMKGPMTTQSLRGLANHGPMHWRGDRTAGRQPGGDPLDESGAFKEFNVAFEGLLGRNGPLTNAEMQAFTDFILEVTYPPNPNRPLNLTNARTPDQQAGHDFFMTAPSLLGALTCNNCHQLDPGQGLFGSSGLMSMEGEPQNFKIPHLRNMYQKVGMFGLAPNDGIVPGSLEPKQDQIRGFGFLHDGSVDTMFRFHSTPLFSFPDTATLRQMEQFMLGFDSNLQPVVGQQTTRTNSSPTATDDHIDILIARSAAGDNDLVVTGVLSGEERGWVRLPGGDFQSDKSGEATLTEAQLRSIASTSGQELTFTAVPPGSGQRMGIDRDEDGALNGDDLCPAVSDPLQVDDDGDAHGNLCDNCTLASNSDQRDSNGDGFGNICDADLNNDGIVNVFDLGQMKLVFITTDNDADLNGDGIVNVFDLGLMKLGFIQPPGPSANHP